MSTVPGAGTPNTGTPSGKVKLAGRNALAWLTDPDGRREERAAATLAVFIMFFPLIVGAFGFGIDLARNVWIRNSIQNAVDSAAVGAAGVTQINSAGKVVIDATKAASEMRRIYAVNRAANPGMTCIGDRAYITANNQTFTRCWIEPSPPTVTATAVTFTVQEQSKNAFMKLLGMPTQTYNLQGKAKVNLSTQ